MIKLIPGRQTKMNNQIKKDLEELTNEGFISAQQAESIQQFYDKKPAKDSKRLLTVFGIFGAILVGLGIILILAHNWDQLLRSAKTLIAFIPLIVGQLLCFYSLIKKNDHPSWRESASVFLVFGIGSSISLISQIYNIPGSISEFMLTWVFLSVPLVYLMRSSATSLLVIAGITFYAMDFGYFNYPNQVPWTFLVVWFAVIPYYVIHHINNGSSNFSIFHHWFIPLSLTIVLGTFASRYEEFMFVAYFSMFTLFTLLGQKKDSFNHLLQNGFQVIGVLGQLTILIMLSFNPFWQDFSRQDYQINLIYSNEVLISILIASLSIFWIIRILKNKKIDDYGLEVIHLLIFLPLFLLGYFIPVYTIIMFNLLILWWGIRMIKKGADKNHLGLLNYGLFIITVLVISRFFDTNIDFVIRGILFVLVGLGFFTGNYLIIKKKEKVKSQS